MHGNTSEEGRAEKEVVVGVAVKAMVVVTTEETAGGKSISQSVSQTDHQATRAWNFSNHTFTPLSFALPTR